MVKGRLGVARIVVQIMECPVIILLHRKFHGKPGQEKSLWWVSGLHIHRREGTLYKYLLVLSAKEKQWCFFKIKLG